MRYSPFSLPSGSETQHVIGDFLDEHFFRPIYHSSLLNYSPEERAVLSSLKKEIEKEQRMLHTIPAEEMLNTLDMTQETWRRRDIKLQSLRLPTFAGTLHKMFLRGRFATFPFL